MSIDELIRGRRTQKAYAPDPVNRAVLEELCELARWAPNHTLTNPWRVRGVETLDLPAQGASELARRRPQRS